MLEGLAYLVVGGEDDRQWDKESKGVDVSHIGELVKHYRDAYVDNVDDLVKEAGIALSLPDNPTTDPKKSSKLILKSWTCLSLSHLLEKVFIANLTLRLLCPKTPHPRRGGIARRKELISELWIDYC